MNTLNDGQPSSTTSFHRRDRVLHALAHKEPDRVPLDLGGMDSTGIHAIAYQKLKQALGIREGSVQVFDPYQMVVKVERSVLEQIGADVLSIPFDARQYKEGSLPDGTEAQFPTKWNPTRQSDGSEIVVNSAGKVVAKRAESGLYFEPMEYPLADAQSVAEIEVNPEVFERFDWPSFCDQTLVEMGEVARRLFEETDYLIMGNFATHVFAGAQMLRGFENFFVDLVANPTIADCLLENLTTAFIERFDKYAELVGPYVQVINVNDDMGTQTNTMISLSLYRKMVKPYQAKLYQHMKSKWSGYLFLHSDGAIAPLHPGPY